jgi:hypothetical protein
MIINNQDKCDEAPIGPTGFCKYSYWHGQACYCTNLENDAGGKLKGYLRCPFAYRDSEDG